MVINRAHAIPVGHHAPAPYFFVLNVAEVVDFLRKTFDAVELLRLFRTNGSILDVEVRIGNSIVMMGEPFPEAKFPPTPAMIYFYVEDCDAAIQRAVAAGGTCVLEAKDMPHNGDRYGGVRDPGGNIWFLATRLEDLTPEEQQKRVYEVGL